MGCCGNSSDYDHPRPQNYQRPPPQARPGQHPHHPQHYAQQRPQQRPQQQHQRQAQAHATWAAHDYGWAGQRSQAQHNSSSRSRDSYFEPGLGQALVGLPGSDFRELSATARAHAQANAHALGRKPIPGAPAAAAAPGPAPPRPAYQTAQRRTPPKQPPPARYRASPQRPAPPPLQQLQQPQQVIQRQPARMPPMQMNADAAARRQLTSLGQRPTLVQPSRAALAQPQAAVFGWAGDDSDSDDGGFAPRGMPVRRDSNGVSECGDDDDPAAWRQHTVSPGLPPAGGRDLYGQIGMGYGRSGAAF